MFLTPDVRPDHGLQGFILKKLRPDDFAAKAAIVPLEELKIFKGNYGKRFSSRLFWLAWARLPPERLEAIVA